MHGSHFVSIVERGTTDLLQLNKSKQETDKEHAAVVQSCLLRLTYVPRRINRIAITSSHADLT